MQIIEDRALHLKLRHPERVLATIPKSRQLDDGSVLVRWGLEEAQVLKNLGIKSVPSPIERKYKWPGLFKPFEHQKTTSSFLTLHRRAFCFNDPGTGKTASFAWAADYLLNKGYIKRVLVICPLSIMSSAWQADLFRVLMHRRVDVAHGDRHKRAKVIASDAEFVIINFDGVETVLSELQAGGFDLVIIDEANSVKTATTKRWKAINALVRPETWLWMATGTPASQAPTDAYGLAKMMNPSSVPPYFYSFRDSVMYKVTQFKWSAKKDAQQVVNRVLQPAIRYAKEDCLDLPELLYTTREVSMTPQQLKYYKMLKDQFIMAAAGETVTSVNAATNLNKLLQISCIAYNTPVLTQDGWVPIQAVRSDDLVWDGVEFVRHKGLLMRGRKRTIDCFGVRMTPDHEVLTNDGWRTAEESAGLDRADVWLPDSAVTQRYERWENQKGPVALSLPLRQGGSARESVPSHETSSNAPPLRLSARQQNARNDGYASVSGMEQHASALFESVRQRLAQLRCAWNNGVPRMGAELRRILGRHARYVPANAFAGANKQQRSLLSGELSLGDCFRAVEQHSKYRMAGYAKRVHDIRANRCSVWPTRSDAKRTIKEIWMAAGESATDSGAAEVFDIASCGPRNRFVVQGADGQALIVHNCGAVYTDDGNTVEFDITHRYNVLVEAVEESAHKVLVFVPYRHAIEVLRDRLRKDNYAVEVIHGGVSATRRTEIFKQFQTESEPRILLIQPAAASHGVTLHAANTVVWWGPVTSNETYHQANARVHRAGQKNPCLVVRLCGAAVERKLYDALDAKTKDLDDLLGLYRETLDMV